jgi:hypothetical protein
MGRELLKDASTRREGAHLGTLISLVVAICLNEREPADSDLCGSQNRDVAAAEESTMDAEQKRCPPERGRR